MIQFQTEYLAEPATVLNEELTKPEELASHAEPYPAQCPDGVQYIVIGDDIGSDHIAYEIVGFGYGYESWGIETARINGNPIQDGLIDRFYDLHNREFTKADGTTLPVSVAMIDSRYLGHNVRETCKRDPIRMIPIMGVDRLGSAMVEIKDHKGAGVYRALVGTQTVKDVFNEHMKVDMIGPGYCHFPESYEPDVFAELWGEHKVTRYKNGRATQSWQQRSKAGRVERLDCRCYAIAGMKLLEQRYGAQLLPPGHDAAELEADEKTDSGVSIDDLVNLARGLGFAGGYL